MCRSAHAKAGLIQVVELVNGRLVHFSHVVPGKGGITTYRLLPSKLLRYSIILGTKWTTNFIRQSLEDYGRLCKYFLD